MMPQELLQLVYENNSSSVYLTFSCRYDCRVMSLSVFVRVLMLSHSVVLHVHVQGGCSVSIVTWVLITVNELVDTVYVCLDAQDTLLKIAVKENALTPWPGGHQRFVLQDLVYCG